MSFGAIFSMSEKIDKHIKALCLETVHKLYDPIWACSLCQKRQQILAKTGKWFQQGLMAEEARGQSTPADISPTTSTAPRTSQPTAHPRNFASTSSQNICAKPSGGPVPAIAGPSTQPSTPTPPTQPALVRQHSQSHVQQVQRQQSHMEKRQNALHRQPSLENEGRRETAVAPVPQVNGGLSGRGPGPGSGATQISEPSRVATSSSRRDASPARKNAEYRAQPLRAVERSSRQASIDRDRFEAERIPSEEERSRLSSKNVDDHRLRTESSSFDDRERDTRRYGDEERRDDRYREATPRLYMNRRDEIDERYSDRDYEERFDRRRNASMDRSDRHDRSAHSTATTRSSSRSGELRRTRSIRDNDQKRLEERVHAVPPISMATPSTHTNRMKKSRLARQHRSMSSSEDEMPSTSDGHSGEELLPRADTEISSEKGSGGAESMRRFQRSTEVLNVPQQQSTVIPGDMLAAKIRTYLSVCAVFSSSGGAESMRRFQRSTEVLNVPQQQSTVIPGDMLAAKIRTYLSHPVTWQPSADQRRLIGHMILHRTEGPHGGDLVGLAARIYYSEFVGFVECQRRIAFLRILVYVDAVTLEVGRKVVGGRRSDTGRLGAFITRVKSGSVADTVVGGRRSDTGRLGAFITRVKSGSVADTVGRLRAGDEVLEWNGRQLQNATFDQVYEIISSSKNDSQVELIVSRSASIPGGDDFLNVQRVLPNPSTFAQGPDINEYLLSAPAEPMLSHSQSVTISPQMRQFFHTAPIGSPVHKASVPFYSTGPQRVAPGDQIFGGSLAKGQIFGRIEISLYYSVPERQLVVTVHKAIDLPPRPDGMLRNPYVKLFLLPDRSEKSRRQSAVLAETCKPIWNEPFYYHGLTEPMLMERVLEVTVWDYDKFETNAFLGETLIDFSVAQLDDEPFFYTLVDMDEENPLRARLRQRRINAYQQSNRPRSEMSHYPSSYYQNTLEPGAPNSIDYGGYGSYVPGPRQQLLQSTAGMRRSRTYDRGGARIEEDWTVNSPSGYLSDHGYSNALPVRYHHRERRPKSATAMRPMTDAEMSASRVYSRNLPSAPWAGEDDESVGAVVAPPQALNLAPQRYAHDPRSPNGRVRMHEQQQQQQPGYGSDGSETLSIHSAHSASSRRAHSHRRMPNGDSEQRQLAQQMDNNEEEFAEEGAISDSVMTKGSAAGMKERKKSLMTRLIPGRNAPMDHKRTGFARSEEVGVPEGLSIPSDRFQGPFTKQTSKESTDSSHSDNWGPILSEGPLGTFVDNLGPGQVVGRQVLASPVLGEIQVGIAAGRTGIDVEIIRAKNLVVKPGVKVNPAPYVKVYLLEGKQCIAKAKTNTVRKTTAPLFQQHLVFSESPRKKMLQVTVLGDYGRMERKSFMGVAQIRLDDLELGPEPLIGWYKLYHSSSLAGTGPIRKDSESSLVEMR
uniref:C2 domain-containing protein n=2 Tax=Ascaris TaxID=6251 RepID=A0A9J2PJ75_ASCLU